MNAPELQAIRAALQSRPMERIISSNSSGAFSAVVHTAPTHPTATHTPVTHTPAAHPAVDYRQVLASIAQSIEPELIAVERVIARGLRVPDEHVQSMLDHVRELGGKRLRPCLTLLCAKACGGITEETIRLAAVVELVHTATLVHDDILDEASVRRHKPTLHTMHGANASVLIGDWLFTHAYGLANQGDSTLPGRWIAQAAKEVCEGEIRQGHTIGRLELTESEYLDVLEAKTGSLCGVSCRLGAWSAGAGAEVADQFERYGRALGLAFQVFDDWLDVWGDPETAGKTLGTDLAHNKPTLPTLRTLSWLAACDHPAFVRLQSEFESKSPTAIDTLRCWTLRSDASEYTLQRARSFSLQACDELENHTGWAQFNERATHELQQLALAASQRRG